MVPPKATEGELIGKTVIDTQSHPHEQMVPKGTVIEVTLVKYSPGK
jgi:hypothetical protein